MATIDITPDQHIHKIDKPVSRRTVITIAAVTGLLLGLFAFGPPSPASVTHNVTFGLSAYPAVAVADWWDSQGRHSADPWGGTATNPTSAVLAVTSTGEPVQCTIIVDGVTVDTQTAQGDGQTVLCAWPR